MGDTSIGMMRVLRPGIVQNTYPDQEYGYSEKDGNTLVAILINEPGFYYYKPPAQGVGNGSTGVYLYQGGFRSTATNAFNMKTQQFYVAGASGNNEIRQSVPIRFSTIDVTGL